MLEEGTIVALAVVRKSSAGLYLGDDHDVVFLPKMNLAQGVELDQLAVGDNCLVGIEHDLETDKLIATMKLYELLQTEAPYKRNERIKGTVYNINSEIGVFVAVDNKYHGLILNKELYGNYKIGDSVEVRIKNVREDGKLELSTREAAHTEIENDARKILERLKAKSGQLELNDKSSPGDIKMELQISKAAFKRAVGKLLKEGAIKITDIGIELTWQD